MKLKGICKKYFMCPQEKLNSILKHLSEIKKINIRTPLIGASPSKNMPKSTTSYKKPIKFQPQFFIDTNKINESLPLHNKTLAKTPFMGHRHKKNSLHNNSFDNKKNKNKNCSKIIKFPKYKMNRKINDKLRISSDKKIFLVKDTKMIMHYKKYKDLYEKNDDLNSVKNTFIDDYKKNLKAFKNVLSVNDNGKDGKKDNLGDRNYTKNITQKTNVNNFVQKPYMLKYIEKFNNNSFQFYLNNSKENNSFYNYSQKKIDYKNKTFKDFYKTNNKFENEKLFNSYLHHNNIKCLKRKKLVDYNCLSIGGQKKGIPKINQDNYIILDNVLNCKDVKIFGVFDGHGEHGDSLTQEIRDMFEDYFSNIKYYNNINIINGNNIYNYLCENNHEKIYEIFKKINETIHQKYSSNNYCLKCGTTTNILILFSNKKIINKIISINLGHTKSILINDNNQIKQLNICHTPINKDERLRIEKNGGEIGRPEWINEGPLRIWYKGKKDSVLSITRSFGDFEKESLGVISIPDIKEYNIDEEKINIIIIATEGLWTFLKNEKIMDVVLPYYKNDDIKGATQKLTEISNNIWKIKNPCEISDITIIVLFFK